MRNRDLPASVRARSWIRRAAADRVVIAVVLMVSTVLVLPYLSPQTPLPKTEDFDYGIVPLGVFARQLLEGKVLNWSHQIGLGSPWPIPVGISHTPLLPLFALLPPFTAVGIVLWLHTVLMGFSFAALARRYGVDGWILVVCVVSAMASPAVEYLYWAEAPVAYLTWTVLPVALLLTDTVLTTERRSAAVSAALGLGLCVGYAILDGHVGILASYLIGVALLVISHGRPLLRVVPLLMGSAALALAIGAERLVFLLQEVSLFPTDVPRDQQGIYGGIAGLFWGLFARPAFLPGAEDLTSLGHFLSAWAQANSTVRTAGFGTVFAVLALTLSHRVWLGDRRWRPIALAFWGCLLLIFIPLSWLPGAVSATWILRDDINLFGILLAGGVLQSWLRAGLERVRYLLWGQAIIVAIGAAPLLAGAGFVQVRGVFPIHAYNDLVDVAKPTSYVKALQLAVQADGAAHRRFIATSSASVMLDREMIVDQGGVNNVAIVHGLSEVSFIAKGVSFDSIRPAQSLPYGLITGDRLNHWQLEGSSDWVRDDAALVTLLGIRAIVAEATEPVRPDLEMVATLKARDGFAVSIYRNRTVLPPAFFVPAATANATLPRRTGCELDVLVCQNVAGVVQAAETGGVDVQFVDDGIRITVPRGEAPRTMLVTTMYRAPWQARTATGDPVGVKSWHGLIQLEIPPGATFVEMRYRPTAILVARGVSLVTLVLTIVACIVSFSRYRRQPG